MRVVVFDVHGNCCLHPGKSVEHYTDYPRLKAGRRFRLTDSRRHAIRRDVCGKPVSSLAFFSFPNTVSSNGNFAGRAAESALLIPSSPSICANLGSSRSTAPLRNSCTVSPHLALFWFIAYATAVTMLDPIGRWFGKPRTPAKHAFDQETEQLLRRKRWIESEQLANLATVERLIANNERWRQRLLEHNRKLNRQLEKCRVDFEKATTPAQATAAQRRFRQCQKLRQTNLSKLARVKQTEEKVLHSARRNAIEHLGMVKRLEARKGYRKLLRKRERAASGGLGLWGTLGMILFINDFQKMAHGIDKLAKKK